MVRQPRTVRRWAVYSRGILIDATISETQKEAIGLRLNGFLQPIPWPVAGDEVRRIRIVPEKRRR